MSLFVDHCPRIGWKRYHELRATDLAPQVASSAPRAVGGRNAVVPQAVLDGLSYDALPPFAEASSQPVPATGRSLRSSDPRPRPATNPDRLGAGTAVNVSAQSAPRAAAAPQRASAAEDAGGSEEDGDEAESAAAAPSRPAPRGASKGRTGRLGRSRSAAPAVLSTLQLSLGELLRQQAARLCSSSPLRLRD